jgi:hypothetical protein
VLAHGLREPSGPWNALHGAGDVGRPVEVHEGLDEGVVVRAARRRAGGGEIAQAGGKVPTVTRTGTDLLDARSTSTVTVYAPSSVASNTTIKGMRTAASHPWVNSGLLGNGNGTSRGSMAGSIAGPWIESLNECVSSSGSPMTLVARGNWIGDGTAGTAKVSMPAPMMVPKPLFPST